MAIHIRHRREALLRMRRRLITTAAALALFCVVAVAISLFCVRELHRETVASFRAVPYLPDIGEQRETEQSSSSSAPSAAAQETAPDIVVSDTSNDLSVDEVSLVDNTGDSGDDGGFSLDVGEGSASGLGSGNGSGSAGGKRGMGLDNDIQIVLALDASGSMDYLFREVSASMERMVSTLCRSRVNGRPASVNVAVVGYGAARSHGAPWKVMDFTTKTEALRRELGRVRCDGDNECCGAAIAFAVDRFEWNRRPNTRALKILILAGNEDFSQGSVDSRAAIAALREEGIILNTIYCGKSTNENTAERAQWREAARLGGGVYTELELGNTAAQVQRDSALAEAGMLLRQMTMLPALPLGSPAEQEKRLADLEKLRKSLPSRNSEVPDWVAQHAPRLSLPDWDAAEQYRRMGEGCTLAALGGRGNLPEELRRLPEERLFERLAEVAAQRQTLLNKLKARDLSERDLGLKILRAVREQGRSRGIIMNL